MLGVVGSIGTSSVPSDDNGIAGAHGAHRFEADLTCSLGVLQYSLVRPCLRSVIFNALDQDPASKGAMEWISHN